MSANNQLRIEKTLMGSYSLAEIDVDGSGGFYIRDEPYATLEEAIKAANEYMVDHEIEYGLDIHL